MDKLEKPPSLINWQDTLLRSFELYANPQKVEILNEINEKYLYWDKVKYKIIPGYSSEEVWTEIKLKRQAMPGAALKFGKYNFNYHLNNTIHEALHYFDLNIGGSLGSKALIPDTDKQRYLVSSVMEEAIASSQIEGAVTTRSKAKEMLEKGRAPRNMSEQMIVNNYKAIQFILSIKDKPLTIELLKEIHGLVTHKTLDDEANEGQFRKTNDVNVVDVIDGEVVYSPPGFTELESLLNELCNFFNNSGSQFIHPIVKGCIIHFMIGYIHPFVDGNGRTARALFYWYLLSQNYWLTEYLSISRMIIKSKDQYAKAFLYTEIDENDLTYFILYNIKVMKLAYEDLKNYIERKIEEKKQLVRFQKIKDVNERQALILKWMTEEKGLLLTVREIQTRLVVSNQTARNDLSGLVKAGFLEEINMNKKTRNFHKSNTFDKLIGKK